MKKILLILTILLWATLVNSQSVRGFWVEPYSMAINHLVWVCGPELENFDYVIERNGVEVFRQQAFGFSISAAYEFYDRHPYHTRSMIYTIWIERDNGSRQFGGTVYAKPTFFWFKI